MLRQLLTLLAIMTGLAAIGAPASARVASVDNVLIETARERGPHCEVKQFASSAILAEKSAKYGTQSLPFPPRITAVAVPCVRLRADRSRE